MARGPRGAARRAIQVRPHVGSADLPLELHPLHIGSVIACSSPILFAFLQMDLGWRPVTASVLVLCVHLALAYVIEPTMTGKAVGLSPLIILVSLSFWGLCWGLTGMFLAIPLTVLVKIILENLAITRPIGKLMAE